MTPMHTDANNTTNNDNPDELVRMTLTISKENYNILKEIGLPNNLTAATVARIFIGKAIRAGYSI